MLDKLFKSLSIAGFPGFGTPEFRKCIGEIDIKKSVSRLVAEHEDKMARHPRGSGFRIRSTVQQLVNRVIRLFKEQYFQINSDNYHPIVWENDIYEGRKVFNDNINPAQLFNKYNALTEFYIKNEELQYAGIIDFIGKDNGNVVIVDFKTGQKSHDHIKQVNYYAVLWHKATGEMPAKIEVRYPGEVVSKPIFEDRLIEIEKELSEKISKAFKLLSEYPANPNCDAHCHFCDVRQFCNKYWHENNLDSVKKCVKNQALDLELKITVDPANYGFMGKTNDGQVIPVVYNSSTKKMIGNFRKGDRCRILAANLNREPLSLELRPWTEIFLL
jgi:CRISPR/Cas system-associated exonuclease Cas4 (RecB family)